MMKVQTDFRFHELKEPKNAAMRWLQRVSLDAFAVVLCAVVFIVLEGMVLICLPWLLFKAWANR